MLSYNLRTDTLLHVPVQPVIVLYALSSKRHIHLSPQSFVKAESTKQRNGDMISPPLPPVFPPLYLHPVPSTAACTSVSPDN